MDSLLSEEIMRLRRILSPAPTGHRRPSTGRSPSKDGLPGAAFGGIKQDRRKATPAPLSPLPFTLPFLNRFVAAGDTRTAHCSLLIAHFPKILRGIRFCFIMSVSKKKSNHFNFSKTAGFEKFHHQTFQKKHFLKS